MPVLFTFLHVVLFAYMVREQATARTRPCADQGTFAAAEQTTYNGTARRRAPNDLRFRVVACIVVVLLPLRAVVRLLGRYMKWSKCKNGCCHYRQTGKEFHGFTFHPSLAARTVSGNGLSLFPPMLANFLPDVRADQIFSNPLRCTDERCSLETTMRLNGSFSFGFPYRYWWPVADSAV